MAIAHATPGQVINLEPFGLAIVGERTKTLVKDNDFEAARLVVHAGKEIPTHQVEGAITVFCLEGSVVFSAGSKSTALKQGDWLYLRGNEPHSLKGIEDSSLLVTIVLRKHDR